MGQPHVVPRAYACDLSTARRSTAAIGAGDAAGLRPLCWHDLRHTYGLLLAANGVDLVTIQAAMGHSALATTGRYLHARPASDQAAVFTRAFEPSRSGPGPATTTEALDRV